MNNDLIRRAALMAVPNVRKVTEYDEAGYSISYNAVPVEVIENAPAVDAEPVRHGRWIPMYEEIETLTTEGWIMRETQTAWKCSECGRIEVVEEPYCNCGAKMDGDNNGRKL